MPYSPQTWIDNNSSYPLSAARMNNIETGISNAATTGDQGHRILTTAQRDALGAVTAGTMIYNSTLNRVQVYYDSAWVDAEMFRTVGANKYNTVMVPPSVRARRNATQSITSATDTFVTWTIEEYDTDDMFAASSDTITIQTAGIYVVTCSVLFDPNATGYRVLNMYKSPAAVNDWASVFGGSWASAGLSGTQSHVLTASAINSFAAADTIKIGVAQNSGGALNIYSGTFPRQTHVSATWMGRAS